MNKLSRSLLLVGALVLALLVGLLIGRGQRANPTEGNAASVQITTNAPMAPAPTPLPAPVQAPQPVTVKKLAPDLQVQEDAAAVGMTTRDGEAPAASSAAPASPVSKTAAATPADSQPQAN